MGDRRASAVTSIPGQVLRWSRQHPDFLCIALIVSVAALLRAALMFRIPVMYVIASRPYYQGALQIAHGLDLTALSVRRVPGYMFMLLGIIGLFGVDPQAIAFVQHILGVLSAVLCYLIGKLLAGRLVGLAAGLLMGANTTLIVYEHQILSEPPFVFLFLLAIYLLVQATRRQSGLLFLLAGAMIGAGALTRLVGQAALLSTPVALWLYYRRLRPTVVACAFMLVGFALVAGPWILRNRLLYSETDLAHGGSPLLSTMMHERPYTRGFFAPDNPRDPDPVRYEARRIIERMAPAEPDGLEIWNELRARLNVTPAEASHMMAEIAIETMSRHPWWYLQVYARKIANLYALPRDESLYVYLERTEGEWPGRYIAKEVRAGILPDLRPSLPSAAHEWELSQAATIAELFKPTRAAPLFAVLFTVSLVGGLLRPDRRLVLIPALAFLASIVATGIVVGDKPRYRYPLEPIVGIVALAGVGMLADAVVGFKQRALSRSRAKQLSAAPS
jgi:4-amino-4-deoxy-L-arabinose transferase-like glycosyltransferase